MKTTEMPSAFSPSSLQDYSDCPRRFQLRYIEQLNWPGVESEPVAELEARQWEGLAFHRLVQRFFLGIHSEKLAALANTPTLRRWWNNFESTDLGLGGRINRAEVSLFFCLSDHRLTAKYDLIAVRGGSAIIYDWKTYQNRPREEWLAARWQTRLYPALLAKAGAHLNNGEPIPPDRIRMIYWFAEFPNEPAEFKYDASQFERDWSRIETAILQITSARSFPLTDDRRTCMYCVFRSYCERGDKAGIGSDTQIEVDIPDNLEGNLEQIGEIAF